MKTMYVFLKPVVEEELVSTV